MTTTNKIFMPIALLMLLPFIYASGAVYGDYTPTNQKAATHAKKHVSAKPVVLWNIASHANWTEDDKAAALRYLYE